MKAKLVVEGKEFDIEINDPELQKLVAPPKKTGYERTGELQEYHCVFGNGEIGTCVEHLTSHNDEYYSEANYYSSKVIASNNARADRLMRQLRRFAVEHRSIGLNWDKKDMTKWVIYYNRITNELATVSACNAQYFGTIYFDMALHAHEAINTFHDELIWYFTKYKDSL